jgi:hypothetical protein
MNKALEAIHDAMDKASGDGRDHAQAVALADKYVAAHPDEFNEMQAMTIEACVQAVEVFRAANMTESEQRMEVWLLHKFEPQNVGGPAQPQVRTPGK